MSLVKAARHVERHVLVVDIVVSDQSTGNRRVVMQHQMLWPGGDVARAAMAKAMPSVRVTQLPGPYLPPFLLFHLKILPPAHNRPSLLDSLPLPLRRCHRCCRTSQISFLFLSLSRLLSPPLSPLAAIPSVSPAVGAQLERRLSMRSRAFQPPKPLK